MPRIPNTAKYSTQQPGTYFFGRFWSTVAVAAKTYGLTEQTIRSRMRRGMKGLNLVKPHYTVHRHTNPEYRKKILAIYKVHRQTPSDLARDAGVTVAAMRYRIKKLSMIELTGDRRVLIEGWASNQIRRRREADIVREAAQRAERERRQNDAEAMERAAGVIRVTGSAVADDDKSLDGVQDDQDDWLKEWR